MTIESLTRTDLLSPFRPTADPQEKIGIEVECATLDTATGRAAFYDGSHGTKRLLELIIADEGGRPIRGARGPIGVNFDDGSKISLEASGAFEYSSPPATNLTAMAEETDRRLRGFAEHADSLALALVPGGNLPFNTLNDIEWIPDEHVATMRDFCEQLGKPGIASIDVSALAITTQTTLDHSSGNDLTEKVRAGFASAAVAAALFVNSPLFNGRPSGQLSWRLLQLKKEDPSRFGLPPFAMEGDITADDFVDWFLGMSMMHRTREGRDEPAPDLPFSELMAVGFDDGTKPTVDDWHTLVSQAWPFVRLRRTIELRLCDGPPYDCLFTAPAFWTGLLYHPPSRNAAWHLLAGKSVADHLSTIEDVAFRGLAAKHGADQVAELAAELLRLSSQGLAARVAAGLEHPDAPRMLDPLHEVVETGQTFAHQQLRRWETDFSHDPGRYVAAYRIS